MAKRTLFREIIRAWQSSEGIKEMQLVACATKMCFGFLRFPKTSMHLPVRTEVDLTKMSLNCFPASRSFSYFSDYIRQDRRCRCRLLRPEHEVHGRKFTRNTFTDCSKAKF